ncbi:MAG: tRNA preQ1(34) S-adenosylmethionine ribosyltransferase-isomerase QueA [Oscillospiraceae bacterium]|nr:tRNA preQ1(34) S-adenosylmethionine ribosyltransferase-isomerase QueA [Candidatus Equicaccousia limihippi]
MNKSDFYFELPQELIAQTPIEPRTASRLLVLDKQSGKTLHKTFCDIKNYLQKGDTLVLNDTKVLPARIFGTKTTGAICEFVLLKRLNDTDWECIAGPGKRAKEGAHFTFCEELSATVITVKEDGNRILRFEYSGEFYSVLDKVGKMPLPPYITAELHDQNRYQTVYAKELGSAAAPTAGLHFTKELLKEVEQMGVNVVYVTLHVGLGTFRPVKAEKIEDHIMHSEHYYVTEETAEIINNTKKNGGRIFCVGTTSCRTVESASDQNGVIHPGEGDTSIFIYPGYKFKCLDCLITNFHLPESTLIMLVSALAGRENVLNAYNEAIKERYRFFSFGDAMLITDTKEE